MKIINTICLLFCCVKSLLTLKLLVGILQTQIPGLSDCSLCDHQHQGYCKNNNIKNVYCIIFICNIIYILIYVPWGIAALLPSNAGVMHFVSNGKKYCMSTFSGLAISYYQLLTLFHCEHFRHFVEALVRSYSRTAQAWRVDLPRSFLFVLWRSYCKNKNGWKPTMETRKWK